jgi:hypothetical protein
MAIINNGKNLKDLRREQQLLEQAYSSRDRVYSHDSYNFDLKPLIERFSFYDLIQNKFDVSYDNPYDYGNTKIKTVNEHGGFLVITDKQYILSYNSEFGSGSHHCSFARCMADLQGGKRISNHEDSIYYKNLCEKEFITARITYEKLGNNQYGYPVYSGRILFNFGLEPITEGKLKAFEQFYNDHVRELNSVCQRYNFSIEYMCSYYTQKDCTLDDVLKFVRYHMDPFAPSISSEDEIIIGVPVITPKTKVR